MLYSSCWFPVFWLLDSSFLYIHVMQCEHALDSFTPIYTLVAQTPSLLFQSLSERERDIPVPTNNVVDDVDYFFGGVSLRAWCSWVPVRLGLLPVLLVFFREMWECKAASWARVERDAWRDGETREMEWGAMVVESIHTRRGGKGNWFGRIVEGFMISERIYDKRTERAREEEEEGKKRLRKASWRSSTHRSSLNTDYQSPSARRRVFSLPFASRFVPFFISLD